MAWEQAESMADSLEDRVNYWSLSQPRRATRSANAARRIQPREALGERGAGREMLGPYETRYEVARGYNTTREVLQP
jgi:hypothetical protein